MKLTSRLCGSGAALAALLRQIIEEQKEIKDEIGEILGSMAVF